MVSPPCGPAPSMEKETGAGIVKADRGGRDVKKKEKKGKREDKRRDVDEPQT